MPPYRLCTMWMCFIIGIISRAATTAPDDKWNFFERAFGHKHLSNVVSSSEGLEIALEHEETIGMDVQGVPLLGCSSYNSGQKIGSNHSHIFTISSYFCSQHALIIAVKTLILFQYILVGKKIQCALSSKINILEC